MGCAAETPPVFNPRQLQQPERVSAGEVESPPMRPLPTTLQSPYVEEDEGEEASTAPATAPTTPQQPVVHMTLQEAIQRTVANSLQVRVAGYAPAIEETRVVEAEAIFDPTFISGIQFESRDRETGGSVFGFGATAFEQETYSGQAYVGVRQRLQTGGQVEVRQSITRSGSTPAVVLTDPYFESELILQISQPLLRDFGSEVNRARIEVARNNQKISLLDFRQTLEETVGQIEQTYWELVQAIENVKIQEDLLADTKATADILVKRRGQDVTRVQISQANASVEERQADLVRARARIQDLSDQLKRLMNDPSLPVSGDTLILPATPPANVPITFDLKDQIETAMSNRLELAQQQIRVDSAGIVTKVAKVNLLPQLNLVGTIGTQGLEDGADESFSHEMDFNHLSWGIGLQFEIPIGNRAARATYQRSLLQQQQAIELYHDTISQVALQVKTAYRNVQTSWDEMRARKQQEFAALDALDAIRQREEADEALTPDFVERKLSYQQLYANARRQTIQAMVNYNLSIAALEQAKGTLLRYNNILMSEDVRPNVIRNP